MRYPTRRTEQTMESHVRKPSVSAVLLFAGAAALATAQLGCTQRVDRIIADSLAAGDPARADAPVGAVPVSIESLGITPTGVPPTRTSAVEPDPILPTMDEVYKTRRLPGDAEKWATPATQPSDHEGPPEGQHQPERPPR
jgi:hypothetical protein